MTITDISVQAKNPNRVNVSVDGAYRLSLDIYQVSDLGLKVGKDYSAAELQQFEEASVFGKLYARTLEYTMIRPHSAKEIRDYLWRKTMTSQYRSRRTGEIKTREGVSKDMTTKVYDRLLEKGYIDDDAFARWWVENRHVHKGASRRTLYNELRSKGVDIEIIEKNMQNSPRDEKSELRKIVEKKSTRYDTEQKLIAYLMRQGFSYDDIVAELSDRD